MTVPIFLFVVSIAGLIASIVTPEWSDFILLFGPSAIASAIVLLRTDTAQKDQPKQFLRRPSKPAAPKQRIAPREPRAQMQWAIVDGSNVMHWKDNTPDLAPVKAVLKQLAKRGYTAGVMFDANAGYKLFDQYRHDDAFAKILGLSQDKIMVVPKGTPADPYILTAARDLGACIITNDQFRDWAEEYPEIYTPGHLVGGAYSGSKLRLDLGA